MSRGEIESNLIDLTEVQGLPLDAVRSLPPRTVIDCGDDWIVQRARCWGRPDDLCWIVGKEGKFSLSSGGSPRSQTKNYGEFKTFEEALIILQTNRDITDNEVRKSLHQEQVDDEDSQD